MQGAALFFGLIILLFAAWIGSGGPNRSISFAGPYLKPIETTGEFAQPYGESRTPGTPGYIGDIVGDSGNSVIGSAEASSYRGSVTLGRNPSGATANDPRQEYVSIRVGSAKAPIRITGWKLVSDATHRSISIPAGTEVARTGQVNTATDILLSSGDEAIIATGASPVGASFRENLCTGYLGQHQDFYPPLQAACPAPSSELSRYGDTGDTECRDFVRNINYCETVASPRDVSGACADFVRTRLSYNGCVAAHRDDAGFLGRTWRVYLGESRELWGNERDTIRLLDGSGKLVDVLSY